MGLRGPDSKDLNWGLDSYLDPDKHAKREPFLRNPQSPKPKPYKSTRSEMAWRVWTKMPGVMEEDACTYELLGGVSFWPQGIRKCSLFL